VTKSPQVHHPFPLSICYDLIVHIFVGIYKYYALTAGALVEGPILSLVAGYLVRIGYFSLLPVILILLAGDCISDTVYFHIVRKGQAEKYIKKYGGKFKFISENYESIDRLWQNHGMLTMFLAKFAYGLTVPLIVSAALSKISYRRFMAFVWPSTLFRYAVYLAVGYLLAPSYQEAEKYILWIGLYVVIIVFVFIIGKKLILKYLNKAVGK
jgi:membrane-associated protein